MQETAVRPTPPAHGWAQASPISELLRPPRLDDARLARLRTEVLEGLDLSSIPPEPAVGAPGWLIVPDALPHVQIPYSEVDQILFVRQPPEGETGHQVSAHPRLFRREPWATLQPDGTMVVHYESTRRSSAASVYFGSVVPEDTFGMARHRRSATRMTSSEDGLRHRVPFSVGPLFRPSYDAARVSVTGRGDVTWRLEGLDPERGTARVFDARTAFRCEPLPCGDGARFVQLPSIRLGPFVDDVRPDAAVISWVTDAATSGFVALAHDGDARVIASSAPGTRHEVELPGLRSSTRYRYHVLSVDHRGEVMSSRGATFRTAPPPSPDPGSGAPPEAFSFIALSDSRSGNGAADERYAGTNRRVLRALLTEALGHGPDFVVFVGDLVDGYTTVPGSFRFELQAWQRAVAPFAAYVPFYEAMGNHEVLFDLWSAGWALGKVENGAEQVFAEEFVNPQNGPLAPEQTPPYRENTFSFDWSSAHISVVTSNYFYRSHFEREDHPRFGQGSREGWLDDRTLEWLEADLSSARQRGAEHLFVMTHEPGFPNGGHVKDGMWWHGRFPEVVQQRNRFFRILARHGVAVVFHGDEHNYSRTLVDADLVPGMERSVWQIISGGAGAPYYAQDRDVPWARNVAAFDVRQHFVRVRVSGSRIELRALSQSGEVLDRVTLGGVDRPD